jgi:hypothetical protein
MRRIACSVDGSTVTAWAGASVLDVLDAARAGLVGEVRLGRKVVLDVTGRPVDPERPAADGDVLLVRRVPRPRTKPI